MSHSSDHLMSSLQRDEAALYESIRDWRFDGVTRELVSLHALLDAQFSLIGDRLALLAQCSGNVVSAGGRAGGEHVLAIRRADGTYDVREADIVAGLADLHLALSSSLQEAATVFRNPFGEGETADVLRDLAEDHKKDASMLRALLWEDKTQ